MSGADLPSRLSHVYWLGGGSGAGKSTVAQRIAARTGMALYSTDAAMTDHTRRLSPREAPWLHRFRAMDMDQRWVHRSPQAMLEDFHWFRGEGFGLIVEDLLHVEEPVVAEGFRLLPALVAPLLADPSRAVWLLPTPDFRWSALSDRGTAWDIPNGTGDPERAQRNLLDRDRMFTDRLAAETAELALPTIEVDTSVSEDDLVGRVAARFGV